jgi:uncharacterized glyoxalase superfamily protein PhnB
MEFAGICLITENVPALAKFYSQVLGVEVADGDIHVELKTKGASIAIFSSKGMEAMALGSTKDLGYGSVSMLFLVEDVDLEYERLRKAGVEFLMLPTTHPWGSRSFFFKDPDGNIITFACRL